MKRPDSGSAIGYFSQSDEFVECGDRPRETRRLFSGHDESVNDLCDGNFQEIGCSGIDEIGNQRIDASFHDDCLDCKAP